MNRRGFLKTTSGVVVGSAIGAAAAKGPVSPNDRVAIAMMGVRGRGRALIGHFASMPDVDIPYICDVDQNVVGAAQRIVEEKKGKSPQLVDDIRRVLDDQRVHGVVIATPVHWHAAGTILACQAGKDVYVEKPVSHNIREGRLMVEAARRYERVVQVGTQRRSSDLTHRFIDYVHSGKIGDGLMAKAWNVQLRRNIGHKSDEPVPPGVNYDIWTGPAPQLPFNRNRYHGTFNWNWHYGGGDIANDGSHWLDLALWVQGGLDSPTEVSGMGRKLFFDDDQQTPDTQNLTYNYQDSVITYEQRLWNSYMMDGAECGISIYGTDGMAQLAERNGNIFRVYDAKGELVHQEREEWENADKQWSLDGETHYENFVRCIRTRERPRADIEVGHAAAVLCHLGNIVTRTGRNLRFDGKSERIVDDRDANRYVSREYRKHWSSQGLLHS